MQRIWRARELRPIATAGSSHTMTRTFAAAELREIVDSIGAR